MFKKRNKSNASKAVKRKVNSDSEGEEDLALTRQALGTTTSSKSILTSSDNRNEGGLSVQFASTRDSMPHKYGGDATATIEIDTSIDRDQRAILERNIKLQEEGIDDDDKGLYKGQAGYTNFIKKDAAQIGGNKQTGTQGPIRAPTFVRTTSRFDYQPDICKDYKETGFCGFGDSCKFLHDRGDYKTGWQLDKEWDVIQNAKKRKIEAQLKKFGMEEGDNFQQDGNDDNQDDSNNKDNEEELPFACFKCRQPFKSPVITLCGHYLCGPCALGLKNNKCPVCQKNTQGVYNIANKLIRKIKERAIQNGEEVDEGHKVVEKKRGSWN